MNKKRIIYISCFLSIFVVIAIVCFIIGRGHTLYFDNKALDGTPYESYDHIDLIYKGEKVTTLGKAERINISLTGQKASVELKYQKKRVGKEDTITVDFELPYNMDGIVINLPALLEGADASVYMSEYVPLVVEEDEEEVPNTDEFSITTEEE